MSERYMKLLREYMTEPDDAVSDAMLAEVLAEGQRVHGRPAVVVAAPVPTVADLIAAEQARARRRHPLDHVGHPGLGILDRLDILLDEVDEVAAEAVFGDTLDLAWELIQVAAVAAAWVQRLIDDNDFDHDDLLDTITEGTPE